MVKKTIHIVNEEIIRNLYNHIARIYDIHRRHLPNQWDLIEWPHLKKQLGTLRNEIILDAGCGIGLFIQKIMLLKKDIKQIVGLDISEKMLEIAETRCKSNKIKLMQQSIRKIPFPDEYFDKIFALEVLHYIDNLDEVLQEFFRVLKKDKKLIISIRHPIRNLSYMSQLGENNYFDRGWHKERWPGSGNIDMISFYRPLEEWINSLTKAGFNIKIMMEPKPSNRIKVQHPDFYSKYLRIPRGLIFVAVKNKKN